MTEIWDEEFYTGTGFPRVFYLKYHLYRLYFPLMALGPDRRLAAGSDSLTGRPGCSLQFQILRGHLPEERFLRHVIREVLEQARGAGGHLPLVGEELRELLREGRVSGAGLGVGLLLLTGGDHVAELLLARVPGELPRKARGVIREQHRVLLGQLGAQREEGRHAVVEQLAQVIRLARFTAGSRPFLAERRSSDDSARPRASVLAVSAIPRTSRSANDGE